MPLVVCNPAFCKLTGYSATEVIGQNCRFLQGEMTEQPGRVELRTAIEAGESASVVLTNFTKDGTAFQNLLYVSPLHDSLGELRYYMGCQYELPSTPTMVEITEHAGELADISARLRHSQARAADVMQMGFDIRSEVTFALTRAVFK